MDSSIKTLSIPSSLPIVYNSEYMTVTTIPTTEPDIMPVPFYQSQGWQLFLEKEKSTSIRFTITGSGVIQTLVIIYPIKRLGGTQMYIPRGPVMSETTTAADVTAWSEEIHRLAKQHNTHWCLIEPDILTEPQQKWLNQHSQIFPKERLPHQTQKMDLTQLTETILQEMNKKTRYNIRLAEKRGVTAFRTEYPDKEFSETFEQFYHLLSQTSDRALFRIHSKDHYLNILQTKTDTFQPYLIAGYREGIPHAIHMFVDTQRETVYLHGGSANEHKQHMAPHLIQWKAITEAKEAGIKTYDFWGTSDTKKSWAGITRFKRKFGGYTVDYPTTRAILFNPIGQAYKLFTTLKQK